MRDPIFYFLLSSGWVLYAKGAPNARLETCCADLGCFSNSGAFWDILNRPISLLPKCSILSGLGLWLTVNGSVSAKVLLDPYDFTTIHQSVFDPSLETKILVHGFTDHYDWDWWKAMVQSLMREGPMNIIRLDWSSGNGWPYSQAVANTRLVGAYLAKFIQLLQSQLGYDPAKIHLIGHSLGAHISGYAGTQVRGVGRISGIDPAGLYFQNMDLEVRLDSTDALFVDTIIADGESILSLGFGSLQPMGHINFFPNGGNKQPGCGSFLTGTLSPSSFNASEFGLSSAAMQTVYQTVGCNHWRALSLYIESIGHEGCPIVAHQCQSYEDFLDGKCWASSMEDTLMMGYYASAPSSWEGQIVSYFAQTTDKPPFCTSLYRLNIRLTPKNSSNSAREEDGTFYLTLYGLYGVSEQIKLNQKPRKFSPGKTVSFVFSVPTNIGDPQSAVLRWDADKSLLEIFRKPYLILEEHIMLDTAPDVTSILRLDFTNLPEGKDVRATRIAAAKRLETNRVNRLV